MTGLLSFERSLAGAAPPPNLTLAQQGLWWARVGDWDRAHGCVQLNEGDASGDWVHAHLHRAEGDDGNAAYWYRRAGKLVPTGPLDAEWTAIAQALLP